MPVMLDEVGDTIWVINAAEGFFNHMTPGATDTPQPFNNHEPPGEMNVWHALNDWFLVEGHLVIVPDVGKPIVLRVARDAPAAIDLGHQLATREGPRMSESKIAVFVEHPA